MLLTYAVAFMFVRRLIAFTARNPAMELRLNSDELEVLRFLVAQYESAGNWMPTIRALDKGWHIAPEGSDDTHSPNWGNVRRSRQFRLPANLRRKKRSNKNGNKARP
jgi:hypothetical protein